MTYQINRYPADLIDVVHLAHERVVIRPVLPQDEDLTGAFFGDLSATARYQRFLAPMRLLPPGLTQRLTQVDYKNHMALVAEVFRDGRERVIAEARYARLGDGNSAELAISVAEPWQGLAWRACSWANSCAGRPRPASAASSAKPWQAMSA